MPGELIPIVAFICTVVIVKIVSDNAIKRKVLEMGTVDNGTKAFLTSISQSNHDSLKWGMVLIAAGVVILLADFIPIRISDEAMLGAVLTVSGLAFIVYYFLVSGKKHVTAMN